VVEDNNADWKIIYLTRKTEHKQPERLHQISFSYGPPFFVSLRVDERRRRRGGRVEEKN
jgi:hypothetical protein